MVMSVCASIPSSICREIITGGRISIKLCTMFKPRHLKNSKILTVASNNSVEARNSEVGINCH